MEIYESVIKIIYENIVILTVTLITFLYLIKEYNTSDKCSFLDIEQEKNQIIEENEKKEVN